MVYINIASYAGIMIAELGCSARVWPQTGSCTFVPYSCAGRNTWFRLGVKRLLGFVPTTGMSSTLKAKYEAAYRSTF